MSNVFALGDWKCPCGNVDASRQEVYIRKLLSRGKMAHVFLDYSYCKGFDRAGEKHFRERLVNVLRKVLGRKLG